MRKREEVYSITYLAVTDAIDHLVIFTVEGVCHEAEALKESTD